MSFTFRNLVIDVWGLTVTVHPSDKERLKAFFDSFGIPHGHPPIGHPFENATAQLFSYLDLNVLLLATYGEMIDSRALCRRPSSPRYIRSGGSSSSGGGSSGGGSSSSGGGCPTCPPTSSSTSSSYTNYQITKWKQESEQYQKEKSEMERLIKNILHKVNPLSSS